MDHNELINDLKDLLIRVEGTINVLRKPDPIRADQKMQGVKDKLRHMLFKVSRESVPTEVEKIRQVVLDQV